MESIKLDVKFNNKTERLDFRPYYKSGKKMSDIESKKAIEQVIYNSYNRQYIRILNSLNCFIKIDYGFEIIKGNINHFDNHIIFDILEKDTPSFLKVYSNFFTNIIEEKTISLHNIICTRDLLKNEEAYKQYKLDARLLWKDDEYMLQAANAISLKKLTLDDLVNIADWDKIEFENFCYQLSVKALDYSFKKKRILTPNL